ncbi:hypothetical protein JCM10908_006159 [Rhodotorula pacifica]|uniref:uncharacterized protein n=1 Tax=Rhodotorula pacifica TaxID=1495444 RepID=UPI003175FD86
MYRNTLNLARPIVRAQLARPAAAALPRSFATSSARLAGKPAEEQSAQHPGKSGLPHLENPSLSEEAVHADRLGPDPLKGQKTTTSTTTGSVTGTAEKVAEQVKDAASKVAETVKDAASSITGNKGQKRSYHSSAVRRAPPKKENPEGSKPVEEQSAQHPGKSDIDHLENPSMSEEHVHADRHAHDPLPGDKKPSRQENKGKSNNVSSNEGASGKASGGLGVKVEPAGKPRKSVDDLPDGEATKRSIESASPTSAPSTSARLPALTRPLAHYTAVFSVLTCLHSASAGVKPRQEDLKRRIKACESSTKNERCRRYRA